MHRISNLILNFVLLLPFIGLSRPAHAGAKAPSAEWVAPAESFLESLQLGLVKIGIPVVGLGLVVVGVWGGMSGRVDWSKVAMIAVAGLLITVGPQLVTLLLG